MIADNAAISLLNDNESNSMKGLLIMLIVLAHNRYAMESNIAFIYLYSFHIYSFYFLPFLYNYKKWGGLPYVKRKLKMYFLPYTVVFLVLLLVSKNLSDISFLDTIIVFLTGSQYNLRELLHSGGFLWFIPTMFSLLWIRLLYYNLRIRYRLILLALSLGCMLSYAFGWLVPLQIYAPLSCFIAVAMLLPSIIVRHIAIKCNNHVLSFLYFLLMILCFMIFPIKDDCYNFYRFIEYIICPILIFSLLVSMRSVIGKIRLFYYLGQKSYPIYLIHIFLYNILYVLFDIQANVYLGIVLTIFVLSISYYLAKIKFVSMFFS